MRRDLLFVDGHRQIQSLGSAQSLPDLAVSHCNSLDGFPHRSTHSRVLRCVRALLWTPLPGTRGRQRQTSLQARNCCFVSGSSLAESKPSCGVGSSS
eukprot:8719107-Pyramimonas_sp.AAC.1